MIRFALVLVVFIVLCSDAIARNVLSKSDFNFLGAFNVNFDYPTGLTLRRDGSTVKLYTVGTGGTYGNILLEFQPPTTLSQTAPFASSINHINYGSAFDSVDASLYGNDNPLQGLYYDADDSRLYFGKTVLYNTTTVTSDICIGYSTLDTENHTSTGVGAYSISQPQAQGGIGNRWAFSLTKIPDWFATAYTGGKDIGVGFGGATSIISNGPASMGPTLVAIEKPAALYDTHQQQLSRGFLELLNHPWSTTLNNPKRAPKPDGMTLNNMRSDGDYTGSIDVFSMTDQAYHGVWIDGATHGLVVFANLASGDADTTITGVTSTTQFTVADAGDIGAGANDVIRVATVGTEGNAYPFETRRVASVVGNTITLQTALSTLPLSGGRVAAGHWYAGGGGETTRWHHGIYIYNPDDIANVADGVTEPNDLIPATVDTFELPGLTYPIGGTIAPALTPYEIKGVAFDDVDRKLYIAVKSSGGSANIYVYQISSETSYTNFDGTGQVPLSGSGTMTLQ